MCDCVFGLQLSTKSERVERRFSRTILLPKWRPTNPPRTSARNQPALLCKIRQSFCSGFGGLFSHCIFSSGTIHNCLHICFFKFFCIFLCLCRPSKGNLQVLCQPCWLPKKEPTCSCRLRDAEFEPGTEPRMTSQVRYQ